MEYLKSILSTEFMPHGHCFFWTPDILWLHVVGDAITATAYYLIPFALGYFVYKRKHLPYPSLFILFGIFILACGTTHIMGIVTLWHPLYRLEGVIKIATALASIGTTVVLYPIITKALRLRSPDELEELVRQLAAKNAELEAQRESFRNIVERDPEGILVLSGAEKIVFRQRGFAGIPGRERQDPRLAESRGVFRARENLRAGSGGRRDSSSPSSRRSRRERARAWGSPWSTAS